MKLEQVLKCSLPKLRGFSSWDLKNIAKIRVPSGLAATVVDVVHRACGGHRAVPRQWWSIWLEGHTRGMAPVVATSKSQSRPPGRRPLWPTQTHLLHGMAPKWSEPTEGALS